jgi:UDP-N-acetylmuramoyl-L-alanyl-D-glutamate--2,6-diaminopimelate ligase
MMAYQQQYIGKSLGDLLDGLEGAVASLPVAGIKLDSRQVQPGDLFIACLGHNTDGRAFINEAVSFGAAAVFADKSGDYLSDSECQGVPVIVVSDLAQQLSAIAGQFYNNPSRSLSLMGVTGTNGKTSCTHFTVQLLNYLQERGATIGTLGSGIDNKYSEGINTTPDAISIQSLLADWAKQSIKLVAMEVSSHGLEQGRVAALEFQGALFTNLSRDHLDYHGTMESYGEAKSKLFQQAGLSFAVINKDDDFSGQIKACVAEDVKVISYSLSDSSADVCAENIQFYGGGFSCHIKTPWGEEELTSSLLGEFNLSNLLGVISILCAAGYPLSSLVDAAKALTAVPGRMERVTSFADVEVVIDYAHTPDALEAALKSMRAHAEEKLWCVFGCGGDRDTGKRPQMGAIAHELADHVVVTSDNPRSESPEKIISDIVAGFSSDVLIKTDRAAAIEFAILNAKPGDNILIAGKGHEAYQQIGAEKFSFSDIKQARLALAKRRIA